MGCEISVCLHIAWLFSPDGNVQGQLERMAFGSGLHASVSTPDCLQNPNARSAQAWKDVRDQELITKQGLDIQDRNFEKLYFQLF